MKIKLYTPFVKDGVTVVDLNLDLERLTGQDILESEQEARIRGDRNPNPLFSSLGNAIIAARASGHVPDDIINLKVQDFLQVTTVVNNFLYGWTLPVLIQSETSEEKS